MYQVPTHPTGLLTTKMGTRPATREEFGVVEFINGNLPLERLRTMVMLLPALNNQELKRMVLGLTPEDQGRFVDRVDQVRRVAGSSPPNIFLITPTKVLPTVDAESVEHVAALGVVCSAIGRLPSSAVLSEGLEKRGNTPSASTGLMDVWRGEYGHRQVSITAFRNCPAQDLEEAKKVRFVCV